MILDKESWCDSVIPKVILEAIDVIRNQLRTPRDDKRPREKSLVQAQYQIRSVIPNPSPGGSTNIGTRASNYFHRYFAILPCSCTSGISWGT